MLSDKVKLGNTPVENNRIINNVFQRAVDIAEKGVPEGIATLDNFGKIVSSQLPDIPVSAADIKMTGYTKPASALPVNSLDTASSAIGKLERKSDNHDDKIRKLEDDIIDFDDVITDMKDDIEYNEYQIESLKNGVTDTDVKILLRSETVQTYSLNESDSLRGLTIYGKTTPVENPTVTIDEQSVTFDGITLYDMDRIEVKDNTVTHYADTKNLFNKAGTRTYIGATAQENETGITITQTTAGSARRAQCFFDFDTDVLLGKTVTVSANLTLQGALNGRMVFFWMNSSGLAISIAGETTSILQAGHHAHTINIPSAMPTNAVRIALLLYVNAANENGAVGDTATYTNVQVEIGDTETPYEPYRVPTVTDLTNTPDGQALLAACRQGGTTITFPYLGDVLYNRDISIVIEDIYNILKGLVGG